MTLEHAIAAFEAAFFSVSDGPQSARASNGLHYHVIEFIEPARGRDGEVTEAAAVRGWLALASRCPGYGGGLLEWRMRPRSLARTHKGRVCEVKVRARLMTAERVA